MSSAWNRLRQHRHGPFIIGGVASAISLPVFLYACAESSIGLTAIVFFVVYLGLIGARIPSLDGQKFRLSGQDEDAPAPAILTITLLAVVAAVVSLFEALNRQHQAGLFEVAIAFASVVLGWLTIHTMFALHYAHLYWRPSEQRRADEGQRGGLDFPETDSPGAWDFLYFSFIIGMTAQTSDTAITTTGMRKINLAHALVSFFFNTVLVAASVNAVVSLAG